MITEYYEMLERGDELPPERYLDVFPNLFKRTKKEIKYKPTGQVQKHIKRLSKLRNEFMHFTPKYSSLAANDFPQMVHDCLEVVDFLAWDSTRISWQGKGTIQQARKHYAAIMRMIDELDSVYNKSGVLMGKGDGV